MPKRKKCLFLIDLAKFFLIFLSNRKNPIFWVFSSSNSFFFSFLFEFFYDNLFQLTLDFLGCNKTFITCNLQVNCSVFIFCFKKKVENWKEAIFGASFSIRLSNIPVQTIKNIRIPSTTSVKDQKMEIIVIYIYHWCCFSWKEW